MSEATCRALVAERSSGLCEVRAPGKDALACRGVQESVHHRRKQSQGGPWSAGNCIGACGHGTMGCHGYIEANPVWARRNGLWLYAGQHWLLTPARLSWRGIASWYMLDDEGSITYLSRTAFDKVRERL